MFLKQTRKEQSLGEIEGQDYVDDLMMDDENEKEARILATYT